MLVVISKNLIVEKLNNKIMDDSSTLIVLESYNSDVEAHIARGVLESNGVKCIINNEIMSSIYPLTLTSIGGIKLLVRREDFELAKEILNSSLSPD